jgi:hypothetical protein
MDTNQGAKMKRTSRLSAAVVAMSILFAAASSPRHAAAAPGVDWDDASASAAGGSLQAGFQALNRKVASEAPERTIYGTTQRPQDAFAGLPACSGVDAQTVQTYSLDEAVDALKPCADALSQRYGLPVTVEAGSVGVDGCRSTASGILFRVPATIDPSSHILMDLSYSIREARHSELLGLPAGIVSGSIYTRPKASAQ